MIVSELILNSPNPEAWSKLTGILWFERQLWLKLGIPCKDEREMKFVIVVKW